MGFWLSVSKVASPFLPYIVFVILVLLGIVLLLLVLWLLYKFFKNFSANIKKISSLFAFKRNPSEKKIHKNQIKTLLPGEPGLLKLSLGIKLFFKKLNQLENTNGQTIYDTRILLAIGAGFDFFADSDLLSQSNGLVNIQDADDQTVIFWLLGDIVIIQPSEKILQEKHLFNYLLSGIEKYRSQRPLDGVLLFQDSKRILEIFNDYDHLIEYERNTSRVLKQLDAKYNITLPLYFILSGLEKIDGFDELMMITPNEFKTQILGFSNKEKVRFVTEDQVAYACESMTRNVTNFYLKGQPTRKLNTKSVLLLVLHLYNLIQPISKLMSDLFGKQNPYNFCIRGVYLSGRLSGDLLKSAFQIENPISTRGATFIKDLLFDKVHSEASLVDLSVHSGSNIYASWLFVLKKMGFLTILLAIGSIPFTTYFFVKKVNETESLVEGFEELLVNAKRQKYLFSKLNFFTPNPAIIENVFDKTNLLYENRLFSWLVPPSWLVGLDGDIKTIAHKTLLRYFFDYFPHAFLERVKTNFQSIKINKPQKDVEITLLSRFISQLYIIEDQIASYNKLKKKVDPKNLHQLLHFLFDLEPKDYQFLLEKEFNNFYFESLEIPSLDNQAIDELIQSHLNAFSYSAVQSIYSNSSLLNSLREAVKLSNRIGSSIEKTTHQDFSSLSRHVKNILSLSTYRDYNWLMLPEFKQSPKMLSVLNALSGISLVGISKADQIRINAQESAKSARAEAEKISSFMIGDLLYRNTDGILEVTKELEKFSLGIEEIFKKRFISGGSTSTSAHSESKKNKVSNNESINFQIIEKSNKGVELDPKMLGLTVKLIDEYEAFFSTDSYGFNSLFLKGLTLSSQDIFINNIYHALLSAFKLKEVSIKEKLSLSYLEIELKKKIIVWRKNKKDFFKIIEFLKKGQSSYKNYFNDFLTVVNNYLFSILSDVDEILTKSSLYSFLFDYVESWDGGSNLFHELEDLASGKLPVVERIISTRKRLTFLYENYASHLIDALSDLKNVFRNKTQDKLIKKWNSIGYNLKNYDQSVKENNSLLALEDFIRVNALQLRRQDCHKFINSDLGSLKSNYFGINYNNLLKSIREKCLFLNKKKAYHAYDQLKNYYKKEIFQHFPFSLTSEPNNNLSLPQFNQFVQNFKNFYSEYISDPSLFTDDVQKWVTKILRLIDIFSEKDGNLGNLKVDLSFEFRQSTLEQGADQIVDWEIQIGNQAINDKSDQRKITWFYQLPIILKLRWAKNSDYTPVPFSAFQGYSVNEKSKTAIFRINSAWSLFELLYRNNDSLNVDLNKDQILLSFQIPTRSSDSKDKQNAIAYIGVTINDKYSNFQHLPFFMPEDYQSK